MNRISGITSDWVTGLDHTGFVKDNDTSLTDIIVGNLPELAIPITMEGICPEKPEPKPEPKSPRKKKGSSSSDSSSSDSDRSKGSYRHKKYKKCNSSSDSDRERK